MGGQQFTGSTEHPLFRLVLKSRRRSRLVGRIANGTAAGKPLLMHKLTYRGVCGSRDRPVDPLEPAALPLLDDVCEAVAQGQAERESRLPAS